MSKLNNARIACFGKIAVYDYECVDEKQQIWKGQVVIDANSRFEGKTELFFSRRYSQDNDLDKMIEEYEITDEDLIGAKFLLVPREKILFIYNASTTIVIPPRSIGRKIGPGGVVGN